MAKDERASADRIFGPYSSLRTSSFGLTRMIQGRPATALRKWEMVFRSVSVQPKKYLNLSVAFVAVHGAGDGRYALLFGIADPDIDAVSITRGRPVEVAVVEGIDEVREAWMS